MMRYFISLIPIFIYIILFKYIPDEIYSINKFLFIIGCFTSIVLITYTINRFSNNTSTVWEYAAIIVVTIVPIIIMLSSLIKFEFNFITFFTALMGLIFLLFSFSFRDLKQNEFNGIKTKWTLLSEDVWDKTHSVCLKTWKVGSLFLFLTLLSQTSYQWIILTTIGLIIIIVHPFIYSYYLYRKL